jgi:Ca2+-binding EF-hand superfamily protein
LELAIVPLFCAQLELEKRLEKIKVDLALRTDFNLIDTFRLFDAQGKGWITAEEVANGLFDYFSLTIQPKDLVLYMNRYDKDRDGSLRYSEFCDSFLPIDPFHAKLLAKKAPLQVKDV